MQNDDRLKLMTDMLTGIRTIKSYGWENHYMDKIMGSRKKQMNHVYWVNFYSSLGQTVFSNFGFYAFLGIMMAQYWRGK